MSEPGFMPKYRRVRADDLPEPDEPGWVPSAASPVRAIVFDTNVFGRLVQPDVRTIGSWVEACEFNGAELWIPELVALELAQRCVSASRVLADAVAEHNKRRSAWGLLRLAVPAVVTPEEITSAVAEVGAVLVETDPDAAAAGLRDQVGVSGMGTVVHDVKTGGSDSAWVRSVIAHNGGTGEGVLWVTSDAGVKTFLTRTFGVNPLAIADHLGQIRPMLADQSPANPERADLFIAALPRAEDVTGADVVAELAGLGPGSWWRSPSPYSHSTNWELAHRQFDLVGEPVLMEAVTFDPWTSALQAGVQFNVMVTEEYVDHGASYSFVQDSYDAHVVGDVVVTQGPGAEWTWSEFSGIDLGTDN